MAANLSTMSYSRAKTTSKQRRGGPHREVLREHGIDVEELDRYAHLFDSGQMSGEEW